jgi:tRNA-intron endonuclease, archaea type
MSGELIDDMVVVEDQKEGCQLFNKGNFGYPRRGGGSELDLVEATFLTECKRLDVIYQGRTLNFEEMFDYASSLSEGFDIRYLVYRDIRQRGFVVKLESGAFDFSVFPRGTTMSNARPIYLVRATSERTALDITKFASEITQSENKGKQLLYGVVDEEGDITYYIMSTKDPTGKVFEELSIAVEGTLIRDRVFVFNPDHAEALRKGGFYGKLLEGMLQLSLIESCYLSSEGLLKISSVSGDCISQEELMEFGRNAQDEFDLRMRAFSSLRKRGLVVKTGFKYGTHFRVYEQSPDDCHARYLVHAVPASKVTMWPEISRTVRLSGGVKKEILFCRVSDKIEYLEFKWFRP